MGMRQLKKREAERGGKGIFACRGEQIRDIISARNISHKKKVEMIQLITNIKGPKERERPSFTDAPPEDSP